MRGYRILEKEGRLQFIMDLKDDIAKTPITGINSKASSIFFGHATSQAELVTRQFLVSRVVSYDFNVKVLAAIGKGTSRISHTLPREWRKVAEKHGIKADTVANRFLWNGYVILFLFFGFGKFLGLLGKNIRSCFKSVNTPVNYTYFQSLTNKNLPRKKYPGGGYDVFSWYSRLTVKQKNITTLAHSIPGASDTEVNGMKIEYMLAAVPSLEIPQKVISFTYWGIKAFVIAVFDILRFRFWHALLFREAAIAAEVRLQQKEKLADEYMFHNSNWIYRPLWTYDAEAKGARISFYFYSSNLEIYKLPSGYTVPNYHWHLANWPHYFVWDTWQEQFIRRMAVGIKSIDVVGTVSFLTNDAPRVVLPAKSIVVFDINPLRDTRYHIFSEPLEFLVPKVVNRFLEDIHTVSCENNFHMVLKRKRDIGSLLNKKYKRVIDHLSASANFLAVDVDIPAQELIEESSMVISLPFTSTALIARELGKPSCFYDPSGLIQKDDRAAHDITIITGIDELRKWVANELHKLTVTKTTVQI